MTNVVRAHDDLAVRLLRAGPVCAIVADVAASGCHHFPVPHNAPVSEFDAVAERYPVFRIDPA